MLFAAIRRFLAILVFLGLFLFTNAQAGNEPESKIKPYRILTSGKQITVRSTRDIKSIMVWTASGHRVVEQKDINSTSYSFNIGVNEKIFFLMLELKGDQRYTEKIGL